MLGVGVGCRLRALDHGVFDHEMFDYEAFDHGPFDHFRPKLATLVARCHGAFDHLGWVMHVQLYN